jgi:excisionase family DNA binding protein
MSHDREFKDKLSFMWARFPRPVRGTVTSRALTIPAAAAYLSVSVKFIRQLIWGRQIRYVKAGRRFVIATSELDRWLSENQRHA